MRFSSLSPMAVAVVLVGCGPMKPTVDAGPDTSCGFDCAAQNRYGLIFDRCFEYSTDSSTGSSPPSLGVWVRKETTADGLFELEGSVKTITVEYRQSGQTVQTDAFAIKNGDLYLMRRIAGGKSVTFKTNGVITGVKWLTMGTASGENFSTSADAFLSSDNSSTPTTYRVTTDTPTAIEKRTPMQTWDTGVKLIFGETPDHGSDPRRVWVPDTGFTLIASPFNLLGGSPTAHYLQRVRDLGTPDAGTEACSLGNP